MMNFYLISASLALAVAANVGRVIYWAFYRHYKI